MDAICRIPSPLGQLTVSGNDRSITGLWLEGQKCYAATLDVHAGEKNLPLFDRVQEWLAIYFSGKEPNFSIPLEPKGSEFRQSVWKILQDVPYGTVITYGSIVRRLNVIGVHTSARAVGGAVGHNPISILIPCHRVIGSDGSLTGYAGGIEKKIRLLQLEKVPVDKLK
ncbi:methylated-DNA--[protein]-cysteine S-methyltransferase [Caproiciproducens sp. CPB-2]|uniref:methylated-DNA--[protein]-cysteine S-methyltransferase n=1 Tax=Caproiciproducens sp. CPB-2 TaxID=3030017 RepID=UPI0023DB1300|nr:methylated-DNA--[protein]-cysteine S-methyltransferase [Caproiciproducens sp. CPB-2]MDF1493182.1 methylated-DNA--[protein]-cysteine S-methyltransferase [Caproiciproducens sp. CPB-2]